MCYFMKNFINTFLILITSFVINNANAGEVNPSFNWVDLGFVCSVGYGNGRYFDSCTTYTLAEGTTSGGGAPRAGCPSSVGVACFHKFRLVGHHGPYYNAGLTHYDVYRVWPNAGETLRNPACISGKLVHNQTPFEVGVDNHNQAICAGDSNL